MDPYAGIAVPPPVPYAGIATAVPGPNRLRQLNGRLDLSQFSDADLQALAGGDLTKVSDAGLQTLHKGMSAAGRPNPYDQFDANPYDQFDTRTPPYSPLDNLPPPSGRNPLDDLPPPTAALNPSQYNSQSPAWQARYGPLANVTPDAAHPVTGEFSSFLRNAALGVGKAYTDVGLAAGQMVGDLAARVLPNVYGPISQQLTQVAAEKRHYDAPLMDTWGGKAGQVAALAPVLAIPGINSYGGAAALGAATGALQPTAAGESRLLNTAIGTGTNLAAQGVGNLLGSWIKNRAAQPFMGWSPKTADRVAAESVGSGTPRLDQPALAETVAQHSAIYQAVRNPNSVVSFPSLNNPTTQAIESAASGLGASRAASLRVNPDVSDLLTFVQSGGANAQQLGTISSRLGNEAATQMTSEGGDRALGGALFDVKNHVDDLIGSTITDPNLYAAYQAVRQQSRNLGNITASPAILNSATGRVNMTALARRLQNYDEPGYLRGGNQSDLYNAARWGQATGEGKGPPSMLTKLGLPWLGYRALNNPVVGAMGGTVSRTLAPVQPFIAPGLQGLGIASTQTLVPYLTQ
jgi:hypothetical protein